MHIWLSLFRQPLVPGKAVTRNLFGICVSVQRGSVREEIGTVGRRGSVPPTEGNVMTEGSIEREGNEGETEGSE